MADQQTTAPDPAPQCDPGYCQYAAEGDGGECPVGYCYRHASEVEDREMAE